LVLNRDLYSPTQSWNMLLWNVTSFQKNLKWPSLAVFFDKIDRFKKKFFKLKWLKRVFLEGLCKAIFQQCEQIEQHFVVWAFFLKNITQKVIKISSRFWLLLSENSQILSNAFWRRKFFLVRLHFGLHLD
jgi:hypothetical protein